MKPIHFSSLICLCTLLVGCGNDSEQPQDWIEVPLSDNTWWSANRDFKQGTYEIVLDSFAGLEFKLGLKAGDFIVYEWSAQLSEPGLLLAEFHGHTERSGDDPGTVMFYSRHQNATEKGTLVAPFDGIHGWYLKNGGLDEIVVTLTVAGFYDEVQ
jgi:hypothetical protein